MADTRRRRPSHPARRRPPPIRTEADPTAHAADHAPGAAIYVIKAIRAASNPADTEAAVAEEHRWQIEHLPAAIRELVLSTFEEKFAFMRLPSQC